MSFARCMKNDRYAFRHACVARSANFSFRFTLRLCRVIRGKRDEHSEPSGPGLGILALPLFRLRFHVTESKDDDARLAMSVSIPRSAWVSADSMTGFHQAASGRPIVVAFESSFGMSSETRRNDGVRIS